MTKPVNKMRPIHPGEILKEDFLVPLSMSANALAASLSAPATRIHEILHERCGITADTTARLARFFGGDAQSWLNLQATYDLKMLPSMKEIIEKVAPLLAEAREDHILTA